MTNFLDPARLAHFDADGMAKIDLARGEVLFLGLNCLEPGQSHRTHTHEGADKFYLVLSGKARITSGEESGEAGPGTLVWCPAGAPHGVEEALERSVILTGIAPAPR